MFKRHFILFSIVLTLSTAVTSILATIHFTKQRPPSPVSDVELRDAKKEIWHRFRITHIDSRLTGADAQKEALVNSVQQAVTVASSDSATAAERLAAKQLIEVRMQQLEAQNTLVTPQERIPGGVRVTDPMDMQFMVAIVDTAADSPLVGLHCGGVLINPSWVLTAAHCFKSDTSPQAFEVFVGSHKLSSPMGHLIPIAENGIKLNEYDPITHEKDIALIKLSTPITDQMQISPASLDDETKVRSPRMRIAGWGVTNNGGFSDDLLFAFVDPVNHDECDKDYHSTRLSPEFRTGIKKDMTCAGKGTADACQGDSGGPLIIKTKDGVNHLEGVASWGAGCALAKFPGVYTRVPAYFSWIQQTIQLPN